MIKVTIGVKEHIVLRHEIEIETDGKAGKEIAEIISFIEKNGLENIDEYLENVNNVETYDTFIEEVLNEDDVTYEAWIVNAE